MDVTQTQYTREDFLALAWRVERLQPGDCHEDFYRLRQEIARSLTAMADAPEVPTHVRAINGIRLFVYQWPGK